MTLLTTSLQLTLDYRTDTTRIKERIQQIVETYVQNIVQSLSVQNYGQIHVLLRNVSYLPDVQYISIKVVGE